MSWGKHGVSLYNFCQGQQGSFPIEEFQGTGRDRRAHVATALPCSLSRGSREFSCPYSESLNAYRDRSRTAIRVALDRVLGFAFIRAWVYLMFVGAAASSMTWSGEQIPPAFLRRLHGQPLRRAVRERAQPASASWRFMTHPRRALRRHPRSPPVEPCFSPRRRAEAPERRSSFGILGAITTGIGSGLIDLGYGELYRNEPPARATFEVPLAFFLAAVPFSLAVMPPPVVGCVVCSLLARRFRLDPVRASSMPGRASTKPAVPAHRVRPEVLRLGASACAPAWWAWPTAWCGRRSSRRTT